MKPYVPDVGDLIDLEFDDTKGHEQAGRRPALVLSPFAYNEKSSRVLACPVTTKPRGSPWDVPIPPGNQYANGVVISDQVRSLDWRARNASKRGRVPNLVVDQVKDNIVKLLN